MQAVQVQSWNQSEPDVMKVVSRLDSGTAPDFETDIKLFLVSGTRELTLNCDDLNYMTAAGMHAMILMAKEMQKMGGKLSVCNLHGQPREMFDACRLGTIIGSDMSQTSSQSPAPVVKIVA